jgi:hypothetical protein
MLVSELSTSTYWKAATIFTPALPDFAPASIDAGTGGNGEASRMAFAA